jgi:DNA-directed RNA polymerase specialized sigma24 family protein
MSRTPDSAFLALVDAHEDTLLRAARLLAGDWDRAEDLLRDTLAWTLAAWDSLASQPAAPLRVRQRLVASYLDNQPRYAPDPADEDMTAGDSVRDSATGERVQRLANGAINGHGSAVLVTSLAELDAADRAVVISRYYLSLSTIEIGEVLGIEPEEVAAAAARALTILRRAR